MKNGLFLGRSTVDIIGQVDLFPHENTKVTCKRQLITSGGPALNASITFSYLGGNSTLLSSIGNSTFSEVIKLDLKQDNVKFIDLKAKDLLYEPPISIVISGNRNGSRTIFNAPAAYSRKSVVLKDLPSFDILLLDQFEANIVKDLLSTFKDYGNTIILDGGSWKPQSEMFLQICDIPIVSENFRPPGISCTEEMVQFLSQRFSRWIITLGQNGLLFGDDGVIGHLEAVPVNVIDTLGAGDIFHGAFCYHYASTKDFKLSMVEAGKIAAKSCKYLGTKAWMR